MDEKGQSHEKQPNQKKEPNWLAVVIVTAIVGGIVQIVVNHFDAIFAALETRFTQVDWPSVLSLLLQGGLVVAFTIILMISLVGSVQSWMTTLTGLRALI